MTRKQLKELQEIHRNEFLSKEEDDFRQAIAEMRKYVEMMESEGFTRQEAIIFMANMCRPQGG